MTHSVSLEDAMRRNDLSLIPMPEVTRPKDEDQHGFLWKDLLCLREVTLLTSQWKLGKTTLLHGLLRAMDQSTPFLDQPTQSAQTWIVSEESRNQWAERQQLHPLSDRVRLMSRPFVSRPTFNEWNDLIEMAAEACRNDKLDLFVIDPLASFLPGRCESDAATLLEALSPLHQLTDAGAAVLLLHHPKKNAAKEGSLARGSGAMLGFVDASMELTKFTGMKSDDNCRTLRISARRSTPLAKLSYEWNCTLSEFTRVHDRRTAQFEANLALFLAQFQDRIEARTIAELRADWPSEETCPLRNTLHNWAQTAVERGLLRREGYGTRNSPYCYRMPNAHDAYYDRGELPPIDLER
jgi:hypothetical protein